MQYNIYVKPIDPLEGQEQFAVEIQPPLSSIALNGFVQWFTTKGDSKNLRDFAAEMTVTRQDQEGTAFVLTPDASDEKRLPSAKIVGEQIDFLLNPCELDKHQVNIHLDA